MFLLTGTPYTTDIKFDVKRILQAIAPDNVRWGWGHNYSDDGIDELLAPWDDHLHGKTFQSEEARKQAVKHNTSTAEEIAKKMVLYTIRRDEKCRIQGNVILRDYIGECKHLEDSLVPNDNGKEVQERMKVYSERYGKLRVSGKSSEMLRCLAYSLRYPDWAVLKGRETKTFWNNYTLQEARSHVRTRRLIEILKEGRQSGNQVVVFCHRVFLLELAAKVQDSWLSFNSKIMELLGLRYGVVAQKNCKLFGTKLTEKYRSDVISKAGNGELDAVVVSLGVRKNGCNLQGCNWMVTLNPMAMYSDEVQAMGISRVKSLIDLGCCCRLGQFKEMRFYVLWVKVDTQDEIAMLIREKRINAMMAMTEIDPSRLEKQRRKKRA